MRPGSAGRTRSCPHCKATILESAAVCPACLHHLRFDKGSTQSIPEATTALRVEGTITRDRDEEPLEYCVVLTVRNERGEEVSRQVAGVGAIGSGEKRTFSLSVDVLPPRPAGTPGRRS